MAFENFDRLLAEYKNQHENESIHLYPTRVDFAKALYEKSLQWVLEFMKNIPWSQETDKIEKIIRQEIEE